MNAEIDWSKAPDDATHYSPGDGGIECAAFWKEDSGKLVKFWRADDLANHRANSYGFAKRPDQCVKRPSAWRSTGLPPVGTVCELKCAQKFTEGTRLSEFPEGTVMRVGGHANFGGCDVAVVVVDGRHFTGTCIPSLLRPIRTPEQIAADEREAAIQQIMRDINRGHGVAARVYDQGYRKQSTCDPTGYDD